VATTSSGQKELHNRITKSYKTNSNQVSQSVESLLKSGLVKPVILDPKVFEVFCFQYENLFTTWVISLEIYHSSNSYKNMKPVYLKGILGCFYPYLTVKGQNQLNKIKL
jgi:hypothetical protein